MILLLGGTGFVGRAFAHHLSTREIPFQTLSRSMGHNYLDADGLYSLIGDYSAEFVINAAGYSGKPNVDACEIHREECLFANAVLPGRIHQACESAGIPWGHVSSGCIYTGRRFNGKPFTEDDAPNFCFRTNNCSFYSGCKALGEEVIADAKQVYQWRLRIPFDHRESSRNYLTKLMRYQRLLDAENSISHLDDFVDACLECWLRKLPFGIYNVTNPGHVSTRRVTELIADSGVCHKSFQFFESEQEFMRVAAVTPRSNCVMSSEKLARHGITLRPVEQAIRQSLAEWQYENQTSAIQVTQP